VDDGGVVEALAARTDSLGVVRAHWTLAKKTGIQKLRAQVGVGSGARSIPPVTIGAVALAGAPTGVVVASGDAQRGAAGTALAKPIVIRVVDANGSGVANAALQVVPSSGTVPDSALTTDAQGSAKVRWTMGRVAGEHTLAVRVDGVKTLLKVAALTTPAAPANLSFDDAPAPEKHARVKERSRHLYALVTDVYGNPVPDATVVFTTKSGSVTPARAVSDTRGRAALTWTPGTKAGDQTLTGAVRSTDVKGTYTAEPGTAHEPAPRATSSRSIPVRKDKR
jgi:hypothetical protein